MRATSEDRPSGGGRLIAAGLVLGVGLGGFVDGIVLHQLLQLHHMVSHRRSPTTIAGLEVNTFWDGVFHAFSWVAVAVGIGLLWSARWHATPRATPRRPRP